MTVVRLACGHMGRSAGPLQVGNWVSCWALMHPEPGCQTQRKVVSVEDDGPPWRQGGLW